jgi:hypothetical protein
MEEGIGILVIGKRKVVSAEAFGSATREVN